MNFFLKNKKGSLSIEILVAVTIVTIAVLSAMAVANKSVFVARQSTHYAQASFLLEEGAEVVRVIRDKNWTTLSDATVGTTHYLKFNGTEWLYTTDKNEATSNGIFTRTINFAYVNRDSTTGDIVSSGGTEDAGTRLVTVSVSWPEGGNIKTKTLSLYLTDLFE